MSIRLDKHKTFARDIAKCNTITLSSLNQIPRGEIHYQQLWCCQELLRGSWSMTKCHCQVLHLEFCLESPFGIKKNLRDHPSELHPSGCSLRIICPPEGWLNPEFLVCLQTMPQNHSVKARMCEPLSILPLLPFHSSVSLRFCSIGYEYPANFSMSEWEWLLVYLLFFFLQLPSAWSPRKKKA